MSCLFLIEADLPQRRLDRRASQLLRLFCAWQIALFLLHTLATLHEALSELPKRRMSCLRNSSLAARLTHRTRIPLLSLLQPDPYLASSHVPPCDGVVLEDEVKLFHLVEVLEFADPARTESG